MPTNTNHQPDPNCPNCPRLCAFRAQNRIKYPNKHNAPVPSFGALDASLLIVGLGPGLQGANFSGRPFTGDYAGDVLYPVLLETGYATGTYGATYGQFTGDDLQLVNCRITNAVRCVPPENKPTPTEIKTCNSFLGAEIAAMQKTGSLRRILVLGRVAHQATLQALAILQKTYPFKHGVHYTVTEANGITLSCSYHCSRYNINTGRMTSEMLRDVVNECA